MSFGFRQFPSVFWPRNHAATADAPVTAELECMVRDIGALRERADIVTASFHWGICGSYDVADYQRALARAAVGAGAAIVIGYGPHGIRAVEMGKRKPVFYSLGILFLIGSGRRTHATGRAPRPVTSAQTAEQPGGATSG